MTYHRFTSFLLLAAFALLSSCGSTSQPAEEEDRLPPAHTSPLGIDQPDPVQLAQSAIAAYRRGQVWAFLSHFGFDDGKTGTYFSPANVEEDPFYGTHIAELRPLAQSLFPLMQTKSSVITFGEPKTIRNRPLTVEVPFSVAYDFSGLNEMEKAEILSEVNTSLSSQGQSPITFAAYEAKIQSMPKGSKHRFIYRGKRWYFDGGTWRPYRIKR